MKILDASEGEWVPATFGSTYSDESHAYTSATFEVTKNYRGGTPKLVEVRTGLGGGDCAFQFEVGEEYIVFAEAAGSTLWTSFCSPTARVQTRTAELRYLRGERPTSEDLEPLWPYLSKATEGTKAPPPARKRAAGRICGEVAGLLPTDSGMLLFQRAGGGLPFPNEWASSSLDGRHFCSELLQPGRYIAYFQQSPSNKEATLTYFPGVVEKRKAQPIDVRDGETAQIRFRPIWLRTQSVSVFLMGSGKSEEGMSVHGEVILIGADGEPYLGRYREEIAPNPWLNWVHLYRITFPQVLPGRYTIFVTAGTKWMVQKQTITVADRSKIVLLKLKKAI